MVLHLCLSRHSPDVDRSLTDAQRFEALYREHYRAVARYAHRRIEAATAEEVVAETFAIAWRRLGEVPDDPLPWLYVVARNVMSGARRAHASSRDKVARIAAMSPSGGSRDPADAYAERDHVRRALMSLSEGDREALRLVAWEGMDHRAAARVCGASRVAFTMRLSRARRRLASALADVDDLQPTTSNTGRLQEGKT